MVHLVLALSAGAEVSMRSCLEGEICTVCTRARGKDFNRGGLSKVHAWCHVLVIVLTAGPTGVFKLY